MSSLVRVVYCLLSQAICTAKCREQNRSNKSDNKPAKVTHFLLCPQLDYLPWILFAEAVSKAMVVLDITVPCLEFIQRCLEHFYCTFFWHWLFFSPFDVEQKKKKNDKSVTTKFYYLQPGVLQGLIKLYLKLLYSNKTGYAYLESHTEPQHQLHRNYLKLLGISKLAGIFISGSKRGVGLGAYCSPSPPPSFVTRLKIRLLHYKGVRRFTRSTIIKLPLGLS